MTDITNPVQVDIKLYLNGFPKAGTHVLVMYASAMLSPVTKYKDNWLGNVGHHAFGSRLVKTNGKIPEALDVFTPNRYIKGHMAYKKELADSFQKNKICKVFIFRDLRDVAVSAAFHAIHERSPFPKQEYYQQMDFDERLNHIIAGDENIGGVVERWEKFAPWLEEDWVLKLTYEDFIEYPRGVTDLFLRYVYGKTASYHGRNIQIDKDDYDKMMLRMMRRVDSGPEMSPTYRSGKIGEWKKYFTDEHKALFKESDKNNWLTRLGYENDRNW